MEIYKVWSAVKLASLITSCKNRNGGFLSRASVSFGFLTKGTSPCSRICVGSQKFSAMSQDHSGVFSGSTSSVEQRHASGHSVDGLYIEKQEGNS